MERLIKVEHILIETPQIKNKREKNEKVQQNIQELWDSCETCNMCVMGIVKGEGREKQTEEIS